jgi:2-polyprenyl-3-methyl-5-hydroxy-6-metoxy-1,4-benzoquinol methylase
MHDRHSNRERYFNEQVFTTKHFVIPYIQEIKPITAEHVVVEIGCGEGGNLKPFLDLGCRVIGIDLSKTKIENAQRYLSNHQNINKLTLIAEDIYKVNPAELPKFDLVILRDTIEHIPNQEVFMQKLRDYMSPDGVVFFAFPPWRMPFGGHQQVCKSKILSTLPYFHLLPMFLYKWVLKIFGESALTIEGLVEIKETGISTRRFRNILLSAGLIIERSTNYLINPNYEIKFKLKTRVLPGFLNIPYIKDFFTTAHYCVVSKTN